MHHVEAAPGQPICVRRRRPRGVQLVGEVDEARKQPFLFLAVMRKGIPVSAFVKQPTCFDVVVVS
jgi:hypothetical protein